MLNVSLICLSPKYIHEKYELICGISKWMYYELTKVNYTQLKFIKKS